MKKVIAIVLLLAGCQVYESQMEACKKTCEPRGVLRVTQTECTCQTGAAK